MGTELIGLIGTAITVLGGGFGIWFTQRTSQRVAQMNAAAAPYKEVAERLARVEERCDRLDLENDNLRRRLQRAEQEGIAHRARNAELEGLMSQHGITVPPWLNNPALWPALDFKDGNS